MPISKKITLTVAILLLTIPLFSGAHKGNSQFFTQSRMLIGIVNDEGIDTDGDGKFNYLKVDVEANVTIAGYYNAYLYNLKDASDNYIYVYGYNYSFLNIGAQIISFLLNGERIFSSRLNPAKVYCIELYNGTYWEGVYDASLSREYNYVEFDPPPAYFTGTIFDEGIDVDRNGKLDYIKVSVEVNVEKEGMYQAYIFGLEDLGSGYVSVYEYNISRLEVGIGLINISLHGPTIYLSGVNPIQVSYISLAEVDYFYTIWFVSISDVPLSRQYFYDEFDPPFMEAEAKFTVYPDGRVVMGGTLNYALLPYPFSGGLDILADVSFTRSDDSTQISADFAFTVQQQIANLLPYKDTSFNLVGNYSGGMANVNLQGSTTFPKSLAQQFPLNLSDFTIMADYSNNEISGTISVPLISGMPLATVNVDFRGNLTDLYLMDDLEVVYGTYFGQEINETVVENMLMHFNTTIPGTVAGSLYEMTGGILECTSLNTNMIKKHSGATVTFDMHIHGDFVQFFVFAMTRGYNDPISYWLANSFVRSIENGHFILSYVKTFKEAYVELKSTINCTKLWSLLKSNLPTEISPQQRTPIELFLDTTLCSVNSASISWTYADSRSDLHVDATIGADFNAEINFIKNLAITYGNPYPLSMWQFVNSTYIDLSNLNVKFKLTKTSLFCKVDGFETKPPIDPAGDPTQFKLERFFNLTYSPYNEPPTRYSRLKIIVEGGYNSTHTVTMVRPPTVPTPDIVTFDQTSMIWLNQSISALRNLIFDIKYQGIFEWGGTAYRIIFDSNSTLSGFSFNREQKQFSFSVTGQTGTVGFCNVSIPKVLLYSPPESWIITIDGGLPLQYLTEYKVTETDTHVFLYFTYSHSTHTIVVRGLFVIYEFDASILLTFLLISTLSLAIIKKSANKRKEENAVEAMRRSFSPSYQRNTA